MKSTLTPLLFVLAMLVANTCAPTHAQSAPETPPAAAPDLDIPAWRLMPMPGVAGAPGPTLACFDQDGVRQILRVQEQARYSTRLVNLHLALETRTQALIAELQGVQREYAALRVVITERNERLSEDVLAAQATTERYRVRLERRRIWPWIALGLGAAAGLALGIEVSK